MATQSVDPPRSTEEKPPSADLVQATNGDEHDTKADVAKVGSTPSMFVNVEPMREEQVENAVKFLSHPKVRGSPVIYRRSFLEKKGLTKEEIDEAFRRVPDPTPTASSVQADGLSKSSPIAQPQAPTKTLQPAAAAPMPTPIQTSVMSQFHWSHAFMAVGLLAVSGAGTAVVFKNVVVPRLKSWIRRVVLDAENELVKKSSPKPSLAEEAATAAKAAAAAAADVAKASQEMLSFKNEERKCFEELRNMLDVQVQEMKSMSNAIQNLEGQSNLLGRNIPVEQDHKISFMSTKQPKANGTMDLDLHPVRSSTPPAPQESAAAPHPKSYMDIIAMIQRGEKPSNIREINDLPPNPNQPLPNPRLAPRPKPWEVGQAQTNSSKVSTEVLNPKSHDNGVFNKSNGDGSTPWLQHKNVRIREIDTENELSNESYSIPSNERPVQQRVWVPPQPPPVAIPEAAAAIRQPKPSLEKEGLANDTVAARTSNEADELQGVTKISELGGVEINGESSQSNSSEIREEE